MPKVPGDKRRYYEEISDPGERTMGRSRPWSDREDDPYGSSGGPSGPPGGYRRSGQPSGERQPGSSSVPYPRQYSGSGSSGAGRNQRRDGLPQRSPAGSIAGDVSAMGRGGARGRRVLPIDIITRPREIVSKMGKTGEPVQLKTNYFKLLSTPDWCLYQYRVDFDPEQERSITRKGLLRDHKKILGAYVFDGSNLYTSHKLPDPLDLQSTLRSPDQTLVQITVKSTGEITKGDYHYLQFFNILMRKCLDALKLQLVGRNYFDAKNKHPIPEFKLELWPGYITSIRQHEREILMCAEITHKVMRDETLLDILMDCYDKDQYNFQSDFKNQVIGVVVLTDYNNNTYRIDDVDFDKNPSMTFQRRNNEECTYHKYYYEKYGRRIRDMQQPLLVSRTKARERRAGQPEIIYLIPELCRSTGLTDTMRQNFRLMQGLAKYTRVTPVERIKKLMVFNRRLQNEEDVRKEVSDWQLELDTELVQVTGRVLPADRIIFKNNMMANVSYQANWTGDLRSKTFVHVGPLEDWVVVGNNRNRRDIQNFVSTLMKCANNMGFTIQHPRYHDIRDDHATSFSYALEEVKCRLNPQLIMCIAANNRGDRYAAIKRKCCVERPVPTQVVCYKNITAKQVMSIATKIAIQINCKIGGIPWTISIPLQGLMVVGFDVCHDTNSKGKDFGAMVASIDPNYGRYFSAVSCHANGEELSSDFSVNMCKALEKFKNYNMCYPKKIVVYRDGVGEGQIPHIHGHEIKQILSKLESIYGSEEVKMTFIIVTKKINTRFFHNNGNPAPGTVVDDVVTDPTRYDFFIVSQFVREGTVTPTSYNIIYDKSGLDVDKLQRLTYKLCHMYFNWSGTVRVPAPCQYAHKLAFLVSQSIHTQPAPQLETLLYFL